MRAVVPRRSPEEVMPHLRALLTKGDHDEALPGRQLSRAFTGAAGTCQEGLENLTEGMTKRALKWHQDDKTTDNPKEGEKEKAPVPQLNQQGSRGAQRKIQAWRWGWPRNTEGRETHTSRFIRGFCILYLLSLYHVPGTP